MFSVFTNYLNPLIEGGLLQDADQSFANVYDQLSIAYNQGSPGVIHTTRFFVPYYHGTDPDEFDADLLYEIWRNKDLQEIIDWFNSKIIPEFNTMSGITKGVRVRICTAKLNKLVDEGKLRWDYADRLQLNMSRTVMDEHIEMMNEDLPF